MLSIVLLLVILLLILFWTEVFIFILLFSLVLSLSSWASVWVNEEGEVDSLLGFWHGPVCSTWKTVCPDAIPVKTKSSWLKPRGGVGIEMSALAVIWRMLWSKSWPYSFQSWPFSLSSTPVTKTRSPMLMQSPSSSYSLSYLLSFKSTTWIFLPLRASAAAFSNLRISSHLFPHPPELFDLLSFPPSWTPATRAKAAAERVSNLFISFILISTFYPRLIYYPDGLLVSEKLSK